MTIPEIEMIHEAKRSKMVGNIHEDRYLEMVEHQNRLEAEGVKLL